MAVVYLNQHLGAAHSKCWLKYDFSTFFLQKSWKKEVALNSEPAIPLNFSKPPLQQHLQHLEQNISQIVGISEDCDQSGDRVS